MSCTLHPMSDQAKPGLVRLWELLDAWRDKQALTWGQAAHHIGISTETIRLMRQEHYDDLKADTKRKIERGLGWQQGSVGAVLAGGAPTPLGTTDATDVPALGQASWEPAKARERNAQLPANDHSPSRVTLEEITITLQQAAQRDQERGRNGQLFWRTWDVLAELHHPRAESPTAPARDDRSA